MKRALDIVLSLLGLLVTSPVLTLVMFLVWKQDGHSPFYIASRIGKKGVPFNMYKLRSMVVDADKTCVDSTSLEDERITPVGHFIRKYKLDELSQLINVIKGDMSLVGPRPNVKRETDLYSDVEKRILDAKPGITDFSSVVFSDEGDILEGYDDPDLAYNQLIRPWKSRLCLIYVDNKSLMLDIKIIGYTLMSFVSRKFALDSIVNNLSQIGVDDYIIKVCKRDTDLTPFHPPGMNSIVDSRIC